MGYKYHNITKEKKEVFKQKLPLKKGVKFTINFQYEYVSEIMNQGSSERGVHLGNPKANDDEILIKYI